MTSAEATVQPGGGERAGELWARVRPLPFVQFGTAAFQFGLVVLLIRSFSLESSAFLRIAVLAWCGFVVHHLLPTRLRLPFFGVLSLTGLLYVFGLTAGATMVGLGLLMIGVVHLPIAFGLRVALLVGVGLLLWVLRAGLFASPVPEIIWPILGSMFMFRLIVYTYDLRHAAAPFSFWRAIGYFFFLPNVCFPLFPVVDYKTYCRTYHSEDDLEGYQRGVMWMLRGCVHLILYRLVYQNLAIDPSSVSTGAQAVQLIVTTYLIYLKVSGTFHLIVGMLRMFCFHLPETNHNWLLSSSFTDFWRRINIYWKDFILKIFFNPVYFPLRRKWGDTGAVIGATFFAFFLTWMLHSYQWFWIRGSFPLRWQDGVFWMLLGAIVCVNMLWERRRGRKRHLGRAHRSAKEELLLALRTVGTFVAVVMTWSIWTAESWAELMLTWGHLIHMSLSELGWVILGLAGLGVAAIVIGRTRLEQSPVERRKETLQDPWWFWKSAAIVSVLSLLLLGAAERPSAFAFAPQVAGVMDRLTENKLNTIDAKRLERGYYEDLVDVARFNDQLASLYAQQPNDWRGTEPATRPTDGFPAYEMIPSIRPMYKGVLQGTNQWGMRDREYSQAKPEGTYRIAVLGSSHTKGSGVNDDETYENLVEDRLNAEAPPGLRYEILNFAVGGYGPLARLAVLSDRVAAFQPDAVLYVGIDDFTWMMNEMAAATTEEREIPFARPTSVLNETGITPGMARVVTEQRLKPHLHELVAWCFGEFAERTRAQNALPLAMVLPRPIGKPDEPQLIASQLELARQAGFTTLDISDAYAGTEEWSDLWIAAWDNHPNSRGHQLLAESVYGKLQPVITAEADKMISRQTKP